MGSMEPPKHIETKFADFEILPQIIIMRAFEGVHLGMPEAETMAEILNQEFRSVCGWIGDRVNSYSVDPLIVPEVMRQAPQVKCWCHVTYGKHRVDHSVFMERLTPKEFPKNRFETLKPAIEWTYKTLQALAE